LKGQAIDGAERWSLDQRMQSLPISPSRICGPRFQPFCSRSRNSFPISASSRWSAWQCGGFWAVACRLCPHGQGDAHIPQAPGRCSVISLSRGSSRLFLHEVLAPDLGHLRSSSTAGRRRAPQAPAAETHGDSPHHFRQCWKEPKKEMYETCRHTHDALSSQPVGKPAPARTMRCVEHWATPAFLAPMVPSVTHGSTSSLANICTFRPSAPVNGTTARKLHRP